MSPFCLRFHTRPAVADGPIKIVSVPRPEGERTHAFSAIARSICLLAVVYSPTLC